MARLSEVTRDQLKVEDQEYFDQIVGSRGSIRGPYGVLLHSPKLAARVAHAGPTCVSTAIYPTALKKW